MCAESENNMLKIYSIRDSKGEMFNTPFFQKTHGEAERSFRNVVKDERSLPSQYPEDFDLYYLGEFDDVTGQIQALDTPLHVIKAVQVKIQDRHQMTDVSPTKKLNLANGSADASM